MTYIDPIRPFDDARFPDIEGAADCFLCGKPVDQLDSQRGYYDEPPAGAKLHLHLPCLDGRTMIAVSFYYRAALQRMVDFQMKRFLGQA